MFDLEQAISKWRKEMLAAGIQSPAPLDELECHLRDDFQWRMQNGATVEQAFQAAAKRIGNARTLKAEFAKTMRSNSMVYRKVKAVLLRFLGIKYNEQVPALELFTASGVQTLAFAGEEPRRFHHDFVGTEHVLLGLLRPDGGIVANALKRIGVSQEAVRREIESFVGVGPVETISKPVFPYTPRAKRALSLAAREAAELRHAGVGAEHIFLGLVLEGQGVAALVLKKLGVDIGKAREEVLRELDQRPEPGAGL